MLRSMTGFASATGGLAPYSWSWELRSVNGKGRELKLRVPEGLDGLEAQLRGRLAEAIARGNVTLSLRLTREDSASGLRVHAGHLATVLSALADIEAQARATGLTLAPSSASDIISVRGVMEVVEAETDVAKLIPVFLKEIDQLISSLDQMRANEGQNLLQVIEKHIDEIETLSTQARELAVARADEQAQSLRRNLTRVMDSAVEIDEARVVQELAMIAVKSDVTEEIDRLVAHVAAARDLIGQGGSVGRKLDFLMQEFNREANTLCAKAQSTELTGCGLALKAVIDQMREQVQNVE